MNQILTIRAFDSLILVYYWSTPFKGTDVAFNVFHSNNLINSDSNCPSFPRETILKPCFISNVMYLLMSVTIIPGLKGCL